MRFLIDASSDARFVAHLRGLGHDVTRVGTDYDARLKDEEILALAYAEGRIVVTDDRDFGEIVFRLRRPHAGIIYLRLGTTVFAVRRRRVDVVLTSHTNELHHFLLVTEHDVRVRTG